MMKLNMKRHRDFESFDRITLELVERWKESELSGDEWRFSVLIKFWFKGEVVGVYTAGDMQSAVMQLGSLWMHLQSQLSDAVIETEQSKCCQPGCAAEATRFFMLKKEYSCEGFEREPNQWNKQFRQFCDKHSHRGDCALEDSDSNYLEVLRTAVRD